MSLYREPGRGSRRKTILLALAGVAILAIGFGIGRATAPEPSLQSQLADLRADAAPAADALELVSITYGTQRAAAQEQLDRAEELFADVEDRLTVVDPAGTREARSAIASLAALVAAGASQERVEQAATDAEHAVRAAGS